MSLRVANMVERAIEDLWQYDKKGHSILACTTLTRQLIRVEQCTEEQLTAYSDAVSIDCESGLPTDIHERNLIKAIGLTLIAELARRGEL